MGPGKVRDIIWGGEGGIARELNRERLMSIVGAVIYPSWWFIYRYSNPEQFDSLSERTMVSAACLGIVVFSYFIDFVRKHFSFLFILCASLITANHASFMFRNAMHQDYVLAMFLVVFAIASCLNTKTHCAIYSLVVGVITLYACMRFGNFNKPVFVSGLVTGLFVAVLAVSTRQRLYHQIVESEERFRTAADNAPVMIWISDHMGFYRFFNQQWFRFTGCSSIQLENNGWMKCLHPDDVKDVVQDFADAFRENARFQSQFRMKRHDGKYRRILNTGVPRRGPDGTYIGYIGSCTDIT